MRQFRVAGFGSVLCHAIFICCYAASHRYFFGIPAYIAGNTSILETDSMTTLAARLPSERGAQRGSFLSTLAGAIEEGLTKAENYQALSRKTDAELSELGLKREDLPRVVMFGRS